MNITGSFSAQTWWSVTSGSYSAKIFNITSGGSGNAYGGDYDFDASKSWTGETITYIKKIHIIYVGDNMMKLLKRQVINILECSSNAFLGLSLNNQPYIEMIKYNYDYDKNYIELLFNTSSDSIINKIIKSNSKAFIYLICDCYIVNIKGKIYYSDEKNKLIFVCEELNGLKS